MRMSITPNFFGDKIRTWGATVYLDGKELQAFNASYAKPIGTLTGGLKLIPTATKIGGVYKIVSSQTIMGGGGQVRLPEPCLGFLPPGPSREPFAVSYEVNPEGVWYLGAVQPTTYEHLDPAKLTMGRSQVKQSVRTDLMNGNLPAGPVVIDLPMGFKDIEWIKGMVGDLNGYHARGQIGFSLGQHGELVVHRVERRIVEEVVPL